MSVMTLLGAPCTSYSSGVSFAQDFANRRSGSGVVWWHDFQSVNEVNNFRWSGSLSNGNDPGALGTNATYCRQRTDDGITGCCLEIERPTGSTEGAMWWRPMSPFQGGTTSGNGRGVGNDDPGAGGTITAQAWSPTQNGSQTNQWARGFYANSTNTGAVPNSTFDGNDWYLQARIKISSSRISTSLNRSLSPGKLFFFTRCDRSLTPQEIVIESYTPGTDTTKDYFGMYRSGGTELYQDTTGTNQVGSSYNGGVGDLTCQLNNNGGREANCWYWPLDQWCTVLWHVQPGTASALDGVSSNNDTTIDAWAAKPGQTSYTQIWHQTGVKLPFDTQWGHSAIICAAYMNNASMNDFNQRWCQIIFSKQTIACPQV